MIEEGPSSHLSTYASFLFYRSFLFYFVWFREQVCIIACPYGRLQGVLLDNKSINVAMILFVVKRSRPGKIQQTGR
jgi:polyferredoxin